MLIPATDSLVNQAEQTMQMEWRGEAPGNTGAHCLGHFKARSSCADLSPRTLGCHTNVIIAKHQILKTIQSEFISSFWAKVSLLQDKFQTPVPLLLGG